MNKNRVELSHRFDDYACMWNGIEDLYIDQTGESLPPNFFFVLAGLGSFCYMRTNKDEIKRLVALGDGRTKQMYEFLAPVVGFSYHHYVHKTFEKAVKRVKSEIDSGYPCVIGALDMYYLPYLKKLYHGEHIPFHYLLAVGYDDDRQSMTVFDCGREEPQELPYEELRLAWDCSYPGLSEPNTVCTIRMNSQKNKYEIAKEAIQRRSEVFLNPPVGFVGIHGFEKFIRELPLWKKELSREDYDRQLSHMVEFYGTVPGLPNALRGIEEPDELPFYGGFDKAERVWRMLGEEYQDTSMVEAASVLKEGGPVISEIKDVIVDYLTGKADRTEELPALYTRVMEIIRNACLYFVQK